jgi:hypothetical protein
MAATVYHDWRQVAQAARDEEDPQKLMQLIEELNHALEARAQQLCPQGNEADKLNYVTFC